MTRILVRLPNWVGDVIMATAALRALREFCPDAHIHVAGRPAIRPLVEGLPFFEEFLPVERGVRGGLALRRTLRARGYDVSLLLPHSFGSAWPIAAARIPRRIGYTKYPARRWLLTDPLPVPFDAARRFVPVPMHEMYLGIVRAFGGPGDADPWPQLPQLPETVAAVDELLERHGLMDRPIVVLNPGAHFGASKLWTAEGFAWVADALIRETGAAVAIVGGPGEEAIGDAVVAQMREDAVVLHKPALGLAALSEFIARCALLLTLDSGPRHMAVAARRPAVVIMGPTDPRYTDACLDHTLVVRLQNLYCIACHNKTCPTEHECMQLLPRQRVLDAALDLMRSAAPVPVQASTTPTPR